MKKIKVKLSFEWNNLPLERQTPNNSAEWNNCKFYINDEIERCDYWVVYGDLHQIETTICPQENTLLISDEPESLLQYDKVFTDSFATIISSHHYIKHKNNILYQQGLPWLVGGSSRIAEYQKRQETVLYDKNYDELNSIKELKKTKLLSAIISSNSFLPNYQNRLRFRDKIEKHFGNRIDVFGIEKNFLEDKWDGLAPYKYNIVLENSAHNDYWTEKLSDAFLSLCYPIYYGAPNIHRYFDKTALTTIDIKKDEQAIKTIENIISSNTYEKSLAAIKEAKRKVLNKYNLFALMANFIEKKEKQDKGKKLVAKKITIKKTTHNGLLLFFSNSNYAKNDLKKEEKMIRELIDKDCDITFLLNIHWIHLGKTLFTKEILEKELQFIDEIIKINPNYKKERLLEILNTATHDNLYKHWLNFDKTKLSKEVLAKELQFIDELAQINPIYTKEKLLEIFGRAMIRKGSLKEKLKFFRNCGIPKKTIFKIAFKRILKKIKQAK